MNRESSLLSCPFRLSLDSFECKISKPGLALYLIEFSFKSPTIAAAASSALDFFRESKEEKKINSENRVQIIEIIGIKVWSRELDSRSINIENFGIEIFFCFVCVCVLQICLPSIEYGHCVQVNIH